MFRVDMETQTARRKFTEHWEKMIRARVSRNLHQCLSSAC